MSALPQSRLALVIDDDDMERSELKGWLSDAGFHVTEARNGREVIERGNLEGFDLVVLDVLMPVADGFDVMRHLRKEQPSVLSRTIVVSHLHFGDLKVFFPEVQALQKPTSREQLLEVVEEIAS